MHVDLLSHLEDLERTLGPESRTFKLASQAFKDHPHLRAFRDPHGAVQICTTNVLPYVDQVEIWSAGTDLRVGFYINDKGARVFSDPPLWTVARRNPEGFGWVPLAGWEEALAESGLAVEVIRKVKWFLAAHQPASYRNIPDIVSEKKEVPDER